MSATVLKTAPCPPPLRQDGPQATSRRQIPRSQTVKGAESRGTETVRLKLTKVLAFVEICHSFLAGAQQRKGHSRGFGDNLIPVDRSCFGERPLARPAQAAGALLVAASSPDQDPEEASGEVPDGFSGATDAAQPSEAEADSEAAQGQADGLMGDVDEDWTAALDGEMQFSDEELRCLDCTQFSACHVINLIYCWTTLIPGNRILCMPLQVRLHDHHGMS